MKVKVETICGRCGKKEETQRELDEVQGMVAAENERRVALAKFKEAIASYPNVQELPEVIVMIKGRGTDAYVINTLDNLCSNEGEEKKRRGCRARVADLIADAFNTGDKPVKPKKEKKEKELPPDEKLSQELEDIAGDGEDETEEETETTEAAGDA
jgi:hypothetical protein